MSMKYTYHKGILWLLVYLGLALLPMGLALSGAVPPGRSFWTELGVAFGFLGLGMLGLQCLFTGRFIWIAPGYGMDNILQYHREIGILAFFFVMAHPAINLISQPEFIEYLDVTVNAPRALGLIFITIALIALTVTSIWRTAFRLSYEWWRLVHGVLSFFIVVISAGHAFQVGHYLNTPFKKGAILALAGAYGYLVIHSRIVRPWLNRRKPYRVVEVKTERCQCQTLILEPVGHRRVPYIEGQFTWITLGDTPFSLQQHPFSLSSSARDKYVSVTAKELGDFTASWKHLEPGTRAFLEGPYGSFTPKEGKHLFLVMGGIGITPAMSMLRTMRDDRDSRNVILIYGNKNWNEILGREELEELTVHLNLTVVHLLEEAPEGWSGETGFVTAELLKKYMPPRPQGYAFYICGPKPIMDITEVALRDMGIDWRLIYTERFKII
ncbi:MAG: ferric reductase-like transmembrane domain-containing protein, partial [Bacteroidales bacterium]